MHPKLASNDLDVLIAEAVAVASRLRRRLGLPSADRDDLRQDLLADLLARLPDFDPDRGSLGAFAGTVLRHRAHRITRRVLRERRATGGGLLSLDARDEDGASLADGLSEADALAGWHGSPGCATEAIAGRIDFRAVLARLAPRDRAFCVALARFPVDRLAAAGFGSRAGLYRRLGDLRLALTAFGLRA